jgi:hypothetical protein
MVTRLINFVLKIMDKIRGKVSQDVTFESESFLTEDEVLADLNSQSNTSK